MASRKPQLKISRQGQETKEVKTKTDNERYISFSFRYFQNTDQLPAQSLETWHTDGSTIDLLRSLAHISQRNITELQAGDKKLTLYKSFPNKQVNEFSCPSGLSEDENWGCLRNIGGQKARVAGFLKNNIFYIVFLDKEHKFYKSSK
ncbi:hypothetical protein HZI65_07130 [Haemophilus haemolyticus]|uniref:Uncharacterized protein n=1 Tax=Haemophilus haemolyticus TaxID=726 RepID=A0A502JFU3_HAEHA|nr:hypothetical protein [Haemophilus haemolyticus]NYA25790.1 hypothetical protein [Haemophilus haemolyticus]TPG97743.1 hypothetical protein EUX55_07185 [Haemophilus haemolyticus]